MTRLTSAALVGPTRVSMALAHQGLSWVKNGGAARAADASGVTLTPDVLGAVRPLRLRATTGPIRRAEEVDRDCRT